MVDVGVRPRLAEPLVGGMPDRFAPGHARWLQTVVLWFTLFAAVASLAPLFQGSGWILLAGFVAALVLGAAALTRAAHWPTGAATAAGALVGFFTTTAVTAGGTAILFVIPTSSTLDRARVLLAQAQESIVSGQAPVPVEDGMLGVIVASVAAAAVLVDLVARVSRLPGLTGVVFAVILLVPALVPSVEPSWVWVVLTVVGFIALLVVSTGRRPSRTSILSALAAVVVAGVATSLLPVSIVSPLTGVGTGTGISTGVNPAINLGNDLRRGSPITVLTYRTSAAEGTYLKLVDLVDFSGRQWSPAPVRLNSADTVANLPAAPGIDKRTKRNTLTTDVSVSLLRSPYLPLPVPVTKIDGVDDGWKYVDASGVTVRSTTEGSAGLDYSVTSRPVDPTTAQIARSLGDAPASLAPYESVDGVPTSITRLAARVADGAANKFDAAVDLQNYFRNGDFTYSEDTPVREGYDGTGLDMVQTFLQRKSGYCVHFASAMAVMARTLGIPSRIAVGFLPGTQSSGSEWTVSSNDLHTWPELYFQGLGWVPFEPTVGQGTTASYLEQTGTDPSAAPSASASASASSSAAPSTTAAVTPTPSAAATTTSAAGGTSGSTAGVDRMPFAVGGVVALLILLGLPWWLRASRRRRRLGQDPPDAALASWREVVDTARDLGVVIDPSWTPHTVAATLAERLDAPAAAALHQLLAAIERERFGGEAAAETVHDDARTVIRGLRARATVVSRVRATVIPTSLFVDARVGSARSA